MNEELHFYSSTIFSAKHETISIEQILSSLMV